MIDSADALACARKLQDGAERVLDDLRLAERVAPYGELIRIGSAASGLMATQDIDLGLICSVLVERPVFDIAGQLFSHPCVQCVQVNDERPPYQSMPGAENESIYCKIRYCEEARRDREWKIDLWFFPVDAPRPEIRMRERLLSAPDDERVAILQLKHGLLDSDRYGRDIFGIDIYRAVLDRGEQSLDEVIRGFMESD